MTELATEAGAMEAREAAEATTRFLIKRKSVERPSDFHNALSYLYLQRLSLDASFDRGARQ